MITAYHKASLWSNASMFRENQREKIPIIQLAPGELAKKSVVHTMNGRQV
jgi:hypothetical protein